MDRETKFNRILLRAPKEERMKYFVDYRSLHPQLQSVCDQIMPIVRSPAGTDIIIVVGPTGAGKSTLVELLVKRITEMALPALEEDRGRLPVVGMKIPATERGSFRWSDFWIRYLSQLENPLAPFCRRTAPRTLRREGDSLRISSNNNLGDMARAVEAGLSQRRPFATIIDEGQHLMRIASGRKVLDHLDVIKTMADMTGVLHILIGTYDLISNLELNGQLSRRATTVHFPRYNANDKDHFLSFVSALNEFQNHLPLGVTPKLMENKKEIYAYCCGCVGILKNWFERTLATALDRNAETITFDDLKARSLKPSQCHTIAAEIAKGEALFKSLDDGEDLLYEQLGLRPVPAAPESTPKPKAGSNNRAAFARSPTRDPVGAGAKAAA
jgi:AAA domain